MPKRKLLFSISDGEIFDAYMSASTHFNLRTLFEEGRRRSILYSTREDAESIAKKLSRQVYGYRELQPIEDYFSQIARTDKTSSIEIDATLSQQEIKQIADELAEVAVEDEMTSYLDGPDVVLNTLYTKTDYSRNRFRQRQPKQAVVRFDVRSDKTILVLPATTKGREIATAFQNRLSAARQDEIKVREIDLSSVLDSNSRSAFFTNLSSNYPDATLSDVTRVKMQASAGDLSVEVDEDGDDALLSEAEVEAFEETAGGVLQAISLAGSQLFGTSIFQQLRKRNFFITSLTWRSRLNDVGNPVVEFNAEFENAENCQLFRYSANAWKVRRLTGEYQESFSPIPPAERSNFLSHLYAHAAACAAAVVESSVSQATSSSPQTGGN
jgi:hypothetical protein